MSKIDRICEYADRTGRSSDMKEEWRPVRELCEQRRNAPSDAEREPLEEEITRLAKELGYDVD